MADERTTVSLFWRLPGIRHIRYVVGVYRVNRHYDLWREVGAAPLNANLDFLVLDAIWRGER